ncbi:MAG: hypothetical protein OXE57_13565 [Alphaproteobacteria bacterium]|nr:hypothetical protein [Alphaproteobacteria bacterium]
MISSTSFGQRDMRSSHEPFHSEILAHATSASQEGLNTDPGRYPEDAP